MRPFYVALLLGLLMGFLMGALMSRFPLLGFAYGAEVRHMTITLHGPFTADQVAEVQAFLRRCAAADDKAQFAIHVNDPHAVLDENEFHAGMRPRQ
jgi:hypothetical protein